MRYLLGTGRYKVPFEQAERWRNNVKNISPPPHRTVISVVGEHPMDFCDYGYNTFVTDANLGHVGDLLHGAKKHDFCGWSASVLQLAMTAYVDESDFIYLEQDALAFGPWVKQMYADMGDGDMVFGRRMTSPPNMPCSQGLFLIRHSFIPHFVWQYIGQGPDGRRDNVPEIKFVKIEAMNIPGRVRRLSFGVDRERPLPYDAPVWFGQKFTPQELTELSRRGLI